MTRVQVLLGNVFGLLVSFNYLSNERLAEHQMTFEDEMTHIVPDFPLAVFYHETS